MINQKKISESYIFLIFLCLFFFDFVFSYIEMIFNNVIPSFTGIIAFVLIIPLVLNSIFDLSFNWKVIGKIWLYFLVFIFLLILMTTIITLSPKKEFLDYFIVFKCLLYFAFGCYALVLFNNKGKYKRLIFLLLLIMFSIMVFNYYFQSTLLMHLNHLRFAESFVFVSLFCLVKNKNKIFQQIVFLITLFSLFLLASRASFYGYLIVFIFLIELRF